MFEKIRSYVANALGIGVEKGAVEPSRDLSPGQKLQHEARPAASRVPALRDSPPRPKWQPTIAIDIERTAKTFAYYLDGKRSFAVLENGTCVGLPEGTTDPQAEVEKIMHAILWAHPDMKPRVMDDGNWVIWYTQPAGTVVFSDVVDANWAYIDKNHLDGLAKGEVLLNANKERNQFDRLGKIALFGRAYMFMDAISPRVVKVCRQNAS